MSLRRLPGAAWLLAAALLVLPQLLSSARAAPVVPYLPASPQSSITLDGLLTESEWVKLGSGGGGPAPGFGAGHEINALYVSNDTAYLYVGIAGNVQNGNHILVFIDTRSGGYDTGGFGRANAPAGVANFNAATHFDDGFAADYVLVIGANAAHDNFDWRLYTLSSGGGPDLDLGSLPSADLGAAPANGSETQGFEARLSFNPTGAGANLAITESVVKLFAVYTADDGTLSNQFISRADPGDGDYGSGAVDFRLFTPDFVTYPVQAPQSSVTHVVISEFRTRGPNRANDEFIELYNPTDTAVDISGWKVRASDSSGSVGVLATIPANRVLSPGCH